MKPCHVEQLRGCANKKAMTYLLCAAESDNGFFGIDVACDKEKQHSHTAEGLRGPYTTQKVIKEVMPTELAKKGVQLP
eukprot:scaffold31927_cov24-Tisochrysis_lutea.AAC.1